MEIAWITEVSTGLLQDHWWGKALASRLWRWRLQPQQGEIQVMVVWLSGCWPLREPKRFLFTLDHDGLDWSSARPSLVLSSTTKPTPPSAPSSSPASALPPPSISYLLLWTDLFLSLHLVFLLPLGLTSRYYSPQDHHQPFSFQIDQINAFSTQSLLFAFVCFLLAQTQITNWGHVISWAPLTALLLFARLHAQKHKKGG